MQFTLTGTPTGLVAQNSIPYVTEAFSLLESGQLFMVLRSRDSEAQLQLVPCADVRTPSAGAGWLSPRLSLQASDSPALISFTSGTEGQPKAIVLSRSNLIDVAERLVEAQELTSEVREYLGVPVHYSFGFGRCRAIAAVQGAFYLPEQGFDPLEFARMLESGEVNSLAAVPSLLRLLLQSNAVSERAGKNLRWLEIGSQYMARSEKESIKALFPHAKIIQHYGLTEASRSTFLKIHQTEGLALESVGQPSRNGDVRVSDGGRIEIRGPQVALGYLVDGKVSPAGDTEGWLTTSDLGRLDNGFLHYLGRADDVVNCAGVKLHLEVLEQKVRARSGGTKAFALARVPDELRGENLLLVLTPLTNSAESTLLDAVVDVAEEYGVKLKGAVQVTHRSSLPTTATGKIQRRVLSDEFLKQNELKSEERRQSGHQTAGASDGKVARLSKLLGVPSIGPEDTFSTLGGDSLRFIQASAILRSTGAELPSGWDNLPLLSVAESCEAKGATSTSVGATQVESSVLLRAMAIVSIVLNHTGALAHYVDISGGAYFLYIAAGFSFSRFQLKRVVKLDAAFPALSILPRIIIPTVLLLVVLTFHRGLNWSELFLVNNWIENDPNRRLGLWFIEVYVQLHVIAFLAFCVPAYRAIFRKSGYQAALWTLGVAVAIEQLGPHIYDTSALYNRVPQMHMWFFALGMCLYLGQKRWEKVTNVVLVLGLAALHVTHLSSFQLGWLCVGGGLLTLRDTMPLPNWLGKAASTLASASLFIYITHFTILGVVAKVLPQGGAATQVLAALLFGVIVWWCFEKMWSTLQDFSNHGVMAFRQREPSGSK